MTQKAVFCWSGGKDSARALYEARLSGQYEVVALLTTVTRDFDRVSMHGVRTSLLDKQAQVLGLPLEKVFISAGASDTEYDELMRVKLLDFKTRGVSCVIYGDIFLEDLRKYREDRLGEVGLTAIFPIWYRDTSELTREFVEMGFKAITTCVDSSVLDESFAGRVIDEGFLSSLPAGVDPCGENGEFHSFVFDGPIFDVPVKFKTAEKVLREGFYFCDLVPAARAA
jgi:uncharacterized protein (TIGR00290 family)